MGILCVFMLALSILLMVYSIRIKNGLRRCNINNINGLPLGLLITSIVVMVMSITIIGVLIYNNREDIRKLV